MSKFDFKKNVESSKSLVFDIDKYKETKTNTGASFLASTSKPANVEVISTYLTATGWPDSVENFDNSARVNITDIEDCISISLEDARMLLEYLKVVIEDAGQIREALTEVLPMKDSDEDD